MQPAVLLFHNAMAHFAEIEQKTDPTGFTTDTQWVIYAGIGYVYDFEKDIFIQKQPFASWTLDNNNKWQPPIPVPPDFIADNYQIAADWDEDNQRWIIQDYEVNPDDDSFVLRIWDTATSSWTT
jgi:hypothetical protein